MSSVQAASTSSRSQMSAVHEAVSHVTLDRLEVLEIARIGQRVEIHDLDVGIVLEQLQNEVAADEPGAAGDEDLRLWWELGLRLVCVSLKSGNSHSNVDVAGTEKFRHQHPTASAGWLPRKRIPTTALLTSDDHPNMAVAQQVFNTVLC